MDEPTPLRHVAAQYDAARHVADRPDPDRHVADRRRHPVVSVITPSYNERDNIEPLVRSVHAALGDIHHEIIVVDDNSPDCTWEVAETLSATLPELKVIRRFGESGLSSAVLAGMTAAAGDVLAVIDADRQHDETALPEMVELITSGEADVVVGTRGAEGGSYGEFSFGRRIVSAVAALVARLFLRVPTTDPMSGYFAVSRQAFQRVGPSINPQGFKILLEFIGRKNDLRVAEVGYTFRNRQAGETKLSPSVIRSYLLAVAELWLGRQIKGQFFLYSLVGLLGFVVNMAAFGLCEVIGTGAIDVGLSQPVRWSLLAGIQASILTNFLANNYFTFWERRFRGPAILQGLAIFELVSVLGVIVHVAVFQFLQTHHVGVDLLGDNLARVVHESFGFMTAFVSNYFLNVNYTWRRRTVV